MGHNIKPGVAGDQVQEILITLKKRLCTSGGKCNWIKHCTNNGNCCKLNAPVIIQFSNGGAQFNAKDCLMQMKSGYRRNYAGALHIHTLAEAYGATVILHTDHCAKTIALD
jgi:fructose-bisphosphate aldolase class II